MSTEAHILIIDDEYELGKFFTRLLERKGYRVSVANSGAEASELILSERFQVAMVDLKLPDSDGLTLLQQVKSNQSACEVVIMTGYSTSRTAVKAIQLGAFDYIEKPFEDIGEVEDLIQKALDFGRRVLGENSGQPDWMVTASRMGFQVGTTPKMLRLVSTAEKIARKNINVLIQGETGTGKEVLARFVHAASQRAAQTFIPVNCGALPESLLESELFGHEKGAFTGASAQRKGIFEIANKGTLFLDEIGEASLSIQVKLLRVLETGEFLRVGGEKSIKSDVRVIAATNMDLEQAVREKSFREDLLYRLDVVRLGIPPLRERREDIPLLVNYFLEKKAPQGHTKAITVSPEAMRFLCDYNWPGNVRELANTVDQAVALCDGSMIFPAHLSDKVILSVQEGSGAGMVTSGPLSHDRMSLVDNLQGMVDNPQLLEKLTPEDVLAAFRLTGELASTLQRVMYNRGIAGPLPPTLQEVEAGAIADSLIYYQGNITMAARALGIGRNTLYRKMKEYRINLNTSRTETN